MKDHDKKIELYKSIKTTETCYQFQLKRVNKYFNKYFEDTVTGTK